MKVDTDKIEHDYVANLPELDSLIRVVILAFIFLFFWYYQNKFLSSKVPKSYFTDYYQIDKKTFNKWIQFFCSDIVGDYDVYLKKRKLEREVYSKIIERLGNVNDHPIMNKKEIVNSAEGTYKSLRECIQKSPELFSVSATAFSKLNKFPPNICKRILENY